MTNQQCPYCKNTGFSKSEPDKGDVYFISSADTKTKQIFPDNGFICELYVCNHCGNIQLKMKQS